MDPDIAYRAIKDWARNVISNGMGYDEPEIKAADEFLALDEWLTKDGFLPQPWTKASHDSHSRGRSGL